MSRRFIVTLIFAFLSGATLADDSDWKCVVHDGAYNYDLTSLSGERHIEKTLDTPPTTSYEKLSFDLCKPLPDQSGVPDQDKCPSGTYACFTTTNKKSNSDDRVTKVVPLAISSVLNPEHRRLSDNKLSVVLHGPSYPQSSSPGQALNVTLECADNDQEPTIMNVYEIGIEVLWKNKAACATKGDPPPNTELPPDNEEKKSGKGSGIGTFFLLLVICFALYFGLGAYYNYNNYGASGWDLVPHRDFWRDVPHLLRDLVSHLFSSVRGNSRVGSRSGYVSV